jgi:hypothetical protein
MTYDQSGKNIENGKLKLPATELAARGSRNGMQLMMSNLND